MLVETDVTTRLLLVMIWAVVAMVPVAGVIIIAAVLVVIAVSLAYSLLCVRAVVARRPAAEPDVADRQEEAARLGAAEESQAFIGAVAYSFTCC